MIQNNIVFVFIGIFLTFLQVIPFICTSSLYNHDDPLWQLDSLNFERIVHGKSNAFIVEFYNSWCGYCIRFAPKWQRFTRDIENWKNVIEVGVVNCVDPDSVKICREYKVSGYPTIKFFPPYLNSTNKGQLFDGERELPLIRRQTIDFLHSQTNIPSHWPDLNDVEAGSIREFWNNLPLNVNTAYVVIEHNGSYVGSEIILDLSDKKHLTVRRVSDTNKPFLNELVDNFDNSTLAIFLKINRDGGKEILNIFNDSFNDTLIRDNIFETLAGTSRVKVKGIGKDSKDLTDENMKKGVYMADLENAIRYALRQEVGVHSDISGEQFTALKNFITILRKYFPGSPAVMSYLIKLNTWIDHRKGNMTGERFVQTLNKLQTKMEYLPEMQDYIGCKGSTPKYRGYPCSLWTLFHILTVQAYNAFEKTTGFARPQPQEILPVIRDYVKYFFTCRECSLHFQKMSENLADEGKNPKDAVLWLWQAHNKVNKRLAGDPTEDPQHPKMQFPSQEACSKCRAPTEEEEIEWDKNSVLRYMQYFYNKEHIVPTQNDVEQQSGKIEDIRDGDSQRDNGNMLHHSDNYFFILSFLSLFRYVADI